MCRFLMVSSNEEIKPQKLLEVFSDACKKNRAPNGDLQEDGWGAAWMDNNQQWHVIKSLRPIWEDTEKFASIPNAKVFTAHARSATFPWEKGDIAYNPPFIDGKYCFLFNIGIYGVKLNRPIPGRIGSEKAWFLLKERLKNDSIPNTLKYIREYLEKNSKKIVALNIGIASEDSINAICKFNESKEYYTLNYSSNNLKIICSEKLSGFSFNEMQSNEIITL